MRILSVPARYRAYVDAVLEGLERDVRNDVAARADEDARVQQLAPINDRYIDAGAAGDLLITYAVSPLRPTPKAKT